MKIKLVFLSIYLISCPWLAFSQAGEWTWMSGVNTANFGGAFGTQGIPNVNNSPPGIYEACEWKDHQGNFWLYGGTGGYGDMWRYNPTTNEWTWMTGTGIANPTTVYGIQGVASASNAPGVRGFAPMSWTDTTGNLWMFGAYAGGCLNDLWMYNIVTNLWTWMSGSQTVNSTGSFGTQGIPSPSNNPPGLCENACTWLDQNNNLWLYGGYGPGSPAYGDVWKYDITAGEWTWMKGDSLTNQAPNYGTLQVPAASNTPGGRWSYAHWTNDCLHFWTFAGEGSGGDYNDMWMFNTLTNNWTWMSGPSGTGGIGSMGTRCSTAVSNVPSARHENRSSVTDNCGKFWFYGGASSLNDLWKYDPVTNEWTYIGPTNASTTPVYGTKGIPDPNNTPGGRMGANAWMDAQNNYWIYGGFNSNYGDLWRYTPDTTCGGAFCSGSGVCGVQSQPPVANFQSSDTTFCTETGKCIHFYDLSTGNPTSWKWLFPGADPDSSLLQNPDSICYYLPGTYPVTLIVSNANGTDTLAVAPLIIFGTAPVPPTVTASGDTLFCTSAQHYQWYFNGAPIAGAIDSFYVATQSGTYSAQITDNGCTVLSNGVAVTITSVNELANSEIKIYPNPAKDRVEISGLKGKAAIEIYNVLGELVYSPQSETGNPKSTIEVDISSFSKGVYIISIIQADAIYRAKMVKQ